MVSHCYQLQHGDLKHLIRRWASGVPRRQTKGTGSLLQRVPPPQPSSDESENSTDEDSLGNSTDSSGSTDETAAGSSEKKE